MNLTRVLLIKYYVIHGRGHLFMNVQIVDERKTLLKMPHFGLEMCCFCATYLQIKICVPIRDRYKPGKWWFMVY